MLKRTLWLLAFTGLLSGVTQAQNARQPANITTVPDTTFPTYLPPDQLPTSVEVQDKNGKWQGIGKLYPSLGTYMPTATSAIDVTSIGMKPGGFDNSPLVQRLMDAVGKFGDNGVGPEVVFPPVLGEQYTLYYFSQPFVISRNIAVKCTGGAGGAEPEGTRVEFVFPPGVGGVIQEDARVAPDASWGDQSDIMGCTIRGSGHSGARLGDFTVDYSKHQPTVTVGGSGYGANKTGTMTYDQSLSDLTCTSIPVLNVTTDSTGAINAVTGVSVPGLCTGIYTSLFTIPGGGLSAGTGATFSIRYNVQSYPNYLTGINMQEAPGASAHPGFPLFTVQPGDGIVAMGAWCPLNSTPITKPGTWVQSVTSVPQKVTFAPGFDVGPASDYDLCGSSPGAAIWDLQASQMYTITTNVGINSLTVLSGPRTLKPGDFIWSDAFPYGTYSIGGPNVMIGTPTVHTGGSGYVGTSGTMTWNGPGCAGGDHNALPVLNVTASGGVITGVTSVANAGICIQSTPASGAPNWTPGGGLSGGDGAASFNTTFNQTTEVTTVAYQPGVPAAQVNHDAGNPGKMWVLPAGLMRRSGATMHNSQIDGFPFGIEMPCSNGYYPGTGCNGAGDVYNSFLSNMIGRMVLGDNTAVAYSFNDIYAHNYVSDVVEAGTTGPAIYINSNGNSAEDGSSIYGLIGLCGIASSTYISMYMTQDIFPGQGYCFGPDATGYNNIGVATSDENSGSLFIASGLPYQASIGGGGYFGNNWRFSGRGDYSEHTNIATASGNFINVHTSNLYSSGLGITDVTHPVIPDGTTVTSVGGGGVTISNNLTGGGVQAGDQIRFTNPYYSDGGPCISVLPGLVANSGSNGLVLSSNCTNPEMQISYSGPDVSWNAFGVVYPMFYSLLYTGTQNILTPIFTEGLQLGNGNQLYRGQERILDMGYSPPNPAAQPWHLWGDTRLNLQPVPGSPAEWTNTPSFTTTLTGNIAVGGTSVGVAACPSTSSTFGAGVPVIDLTGTSSNGIVLSHDLSPYASCSGGLLTLQYGSKNAGVNGDTIQFMQWRPAGIVSNDPYGVVYHIGYTGGMGVVGLLTDYPCNGSNVGSSIVTDGLSISTAGYGAVLTTGGGSLTRPVFCDGTSWTYH